MFGGGFWGPALGGDEDHLSKERDPPPRPVKLEFPEYVPPFKPHVLDRKLSSRLRYKICHSKSFLDITDADLEGLNICFKKEQSISSLLPDDQFVSRPLLYDDDLQAMLDEIEIPNEDAFREVLRMPPLEGRLKPRLAYARNFFGGLEDMARYFDSSQDQYYRVPIDSSGKKDEASTNFQPVKSVDDAEAKKASGGPFKDESGTKEVYKGYRVSSAESLSPGTRIALLKNFLKTTMHKFQCRDHESITSPREKLTLQGVRIQSIQYHFCVARIPQDIKMARARFVEGPVMAVSTRDELRWKEKTGLETPEKTGFVGERFDLFREVGCLLILANQRGRTEKQTTTNKDDQWWTTKQRWGGGPAKWGQLAFEIFEDEDPSWSPEERRLQEERRKQQQEEDRSNDIGAKPVDPKKLEVDDLIADKSSSIGADSGRTSNVPSLQSNKDPSLLPADLDLRPKKKKLRSMDRPQGDIAVFKDGKRLMYVPPFRRKWYQDWQKLRPNASTIDEKIISKKIGATKGDEFDEVFMLTSVNHHAALVKMRVHPDYIAWVETGKSVAEEPWAEADKKKNVVYVSRTKWFDLFEVESRKELLIGLWRVFCLINRVHVPDSEYVKMSEKRESQMVKE